MSDRNPAQSIQLSTDCMERFADSFEVSARRWELVVYPSLVAFIVLAIYGFYLIYSLTKDVHELTHTVKTLTETVDRNMTIVAVNMDRISGEMTQISADMQEISQDTKVLMPMNANMAQMQYSAAAMAAHTHSMQRDMRNVSGPMSFVSSFLPVR